MWCAQAHIGPMTSRQPVDVLIVDDDPFLRHILVADLGEVCRVEAIGPNAAPFESVAQRRPKILLSDLSMPTWSGEELARFAMGLPDRPAIFLMSGNAARLQAARSLADETLLKPFPLRTLRELVVSHLQCRA
jgi:CheY-like chemotaxis protein